MRMADSKWKFREVGPGLADHHRRTDSIFADDFRGTGRPVGRAEAWFNNISTMKADFIQVASDGTTATGEMHLRRRTG